jgi:hypothetical protein
MTFKYVNEMTFGDYWNETNWLGKVVWFVPVTSAWILMTSMLCVFTPIVRLTSKRG